MVRVVRWGARALALLAAVFAPMGCRAVPVAPPGAIHLVDLYEPPDDQASPPPAAPSPPAGELRAADWRAVAGIRGLASAQGRLKGEATASSALLRLERTEGLDERDLVHAVEVRMKVSAGDTLSVDWSGAPKLSDEEIVSGAESFPPIDTMAITPSETVRSHVLTLRRPPRGGEVRHLILSPTNAAGAKFEIEKVRLIFRREHLAAVASGIGWQGLADVYGETIVARSPESLRFDVTLPDRPLLDLQVGSIEDAPVTFRVALGPQAAAGREAPATLLERTVTRAHRWEPAPVDLSAYAGRRVTLWLSLEAARPGTLGFWGAPVIRRRSGAAEGVILIWADTLRRDHLSVYGYARDTSPHLARMAKEGTLFSDFHDNASWTKVSTPSLLTSLYPTSHGVVDFSDRLPAAATTLAESYRAAGYATLSFSSILFTGRFTNLHQGFEVVHEDTSLPDQSSSKTAREYVDRLLPWLEAHREVPYFVFLHVSDPHDPYRPYPPYDAMWTDPAMADEQERRLERARKVIDDPLLRRFGMPSKDELQRAGVDVEAYAEHNRGWYDGSIRAMDEEIGRLVQRLGQMGMDRRTLVVFTGDHGEEFYEHGRAFHGQSLYGELTNSPLIFWKPGAIPAGRVVDRTSQTIDLMPTLLELSGLPSVEGMQGRSLAALLAPRAGGGLQAAGGEPASPAAFAEKHRTLEVSGGPPPRDTESYSIERDGWKLIHNILRPEGRPEFELYETRSDPLNLRDRSAERPELVQRLARELASWREQAKKARLPSDPEAAGALSPEELERLRSLGYVQ